MTHPCLVGVRVVWELNTQELGTNLLAPKQIGFHGLPYSSLPFFFQLYVLDGLAPFQGQKLVE